MTDYWVSSKKHYCDICKCWISGNALNIKNHESSARHISSLRKKLIDSHRKQVSQQRQDEFEKEEIARINAVALEGASAAPAADNGGLTSSSLFTYTRILNPPVDKDKERARLAEQLSRALAGAPMEDPNAQNKSVWMAFVDNEDGTLTYYNKVTGVKTKSHPKDFDGVLPVGSSSLTSNWKLKFDPSKGAKYYHNEVTGEIRWLEQTELSSVDIKPRAVQKSQSQPVIKVEVDLPQPDAGRKPSHIKVKLEPSEAAIKSQDASSSVTHPVPHVKSEPEDNGPASSDAYTPSNQQSVEEPKRPKEQYETTIGAWEVVKPEDSVFSHSIVSLEPYVNPPKEPPRQQDVFNELRQETYEMPLLNVDDLQLQEKRTFQKQDVETSAEPVQFSKRKVPKRSNA